MLQNIYCYQQENKCKVRKRKPQWISIPKLELQRVMQGRAGISVPHLPPEGHILTHADGAAGIQLAAWGALTSKGASIVPADTVHTRVRGALIDICRKKGTVTVVSAVGPRILGQVFGETRSKECEEGRFSAVQRITSPGYSNSACTTQVCIISGWTDTDSTHHYSELLQG